MSDTPIEKTAPAKAGAKTPRRRASEPVSKQTPAQAAGGDAAKPSPAQPSPAQRSPAQASGSEAAKAKAGEAKAPKTEAREAKALETDAPKGEAARAAPPRARPAKPVAADVGAVKAGSARPAMPARESEAKSAEKDAFLRAKAPAPEADKPAPAAEAPAPVSAAEKPALEMRAKTQPAARARKPAKKAARPPKAKPAAAPTERPTEAAEALAREGVDTAAAAAAALVTGCAEINAALFALAGETMARGLAAASALAGCRSYGEAIAVEADFVKRTAEACVSESERIVGISLRTADAAIAPLNAGILRAAATLSRPFAR